MTGTKCDLLYQVEQGKATQARPNKDLMLSENMQLILRVQRAEFEQQSLEEEKSILFCKILPLLLPASSGDGQIIISGPPGGHEQDKHSSGLGFW